MLPVDTRMARCPLKQEIRDTLWVPYIRRLGAGFRRYLTLYSPPLMDVKHLQSQGLIVLRNGVYERVVGVTFDEAAYAEVQREAQGRLELLLYGDLNRLLIGDPQRSDQCRQLRDAFPFQAVNLDYTGSLFARVNARPISLHLQALDQVFRFQARSNVRQFCLFITTRTGVQDLSRRFLSNLAERLEANIRTTPRFDAAYEAAFPGIRPAQLRRNAHTDFVSVGLVKLVANGLADHNFAIREADAVWLVRDSEAPARELLHLAFFVERHEPVPPRHVRDIGRRRVLETRVIAFVRKRVQSPFRRLTEIGDSAVLEARHGGHIRRLAAATFEHEIIDGVLDRLGEE